jgi:hypothetical protein
MFDFIYTTAMFCAFKTTMAPRKDLHYMTIGTAWNMQSLMATLAPEEPAAVPMVQDAAEQTTVKMEE